MAKQKHIEQDGVIVEALSNAMFRGNWKMGMFSSLIFQENENALHKTFTRR